MGSASDTVIESMAILFGLGMTTTEVMHAIRLWHMYTSASYVKWGIVFLSVVYNVVQWALIASYLHAAGGPLHFYDGKTWVPALVTHSILYILTIVRAFVPRERSADGKWLRNRVLREGTLIFSVTFATTVFTTAGSLSTNPLISIPARFSPLMLSATSAAMSRLMFNIRSLSAFLGTDPAWILSNLEMSRVRWTQGARRGERWVEVDAACAGGELKRKASMWLDPTTKIRVVTAPAGVLGDEEDEAYLVETVEDGGIVV
ncbi:hypothetical protein GLOTRDRAFT_134812 [Gloeophyllum trabeum ATCC 11539]|uniref:Uncharacterized protein n=1 Tax=Gloeophyllum trabeum (strain ATCC 11539 / FP-39264 / Madison 617) TaxID=670483 RepID=S7QL86_GLOTA|nr:uncharacterized protein GLOTRDRAFT_134812 [Gloeophyllum trabeum ATCC 11539]EPQ60052.1 hypothetical protein GLOTRDRAFT_134812 [Gloeophyllum trabeum ATCC 11539]